MKKYLALVLSACMLLAFAACARQPQPSISTDTQQIPSPWTDYASLDEAEAAAGFDLAIPDAVDGCSEKQFRALDADGDKMIEVIYASGEDEIARIRKAPGAEDISGDCNTYTTIEEQTVDGHTVLCKGNDGLIYTATWTDGEYSYAVMCDAGMSVGQLTAWVETLA